MGVQFSYQMWVPHERLYDALASLARRDENGALLPLVWPDGRRLPGADAAAETGALVPVEFAQATIGDFLGQLVFPVPARAESIVGEFTFGGRQWLEGEADLTWLCVQAIGSRSSGDYAEDATRAWFVGLAREVGAYCGALDYEGPFGLLWFEGEECDHEFEEEGDASFSEPFQLAQFVGREQSAAARQMAPFAGYPSELSAHQMAELITLARDANSGVRAAALRALRSQKTAQTWALVEAALSDADWRVRADNIGWFAESGDLQCVAKIERLLDDPHSTVQIEAIQTLGWLNAARERRAALLRLPPTSGNLGVIRAALHSFSPPYANAQLLEDEDEAVQRNRALIEEAARASDFPFPDAAEDIGQW